MGDVRVTLRSSTDPRAQRTRERLFEAAQRLSAAGDSVTVTALAREAGVSRSVFYTHFSDIGELALRMQEPHFAAIAATASVDRERDPSGAMLRSQRALVAHFAEHRELYRAALELPGHVVAERMLEAMRAPIEAHIVAIGGPPGGLHADAAARYVAAGATHVIEEWLLGRLELTDEALAQHLYALMPQWLHASERWSATPPTQPREKELP